eukprot:CAMPEP_0197174124 /NCGR_PEP_ID=MMETSP1423-20130617/782_1 /TAXON_ID=476441 /ORGANISM="Pseudo-nitzschia heimii, Strain UNC1101" /LENGTH=216 /DNA_ID=CAMNT_0042623021 /DNA_START=261 /DNA_END=913 /DNA_ORIENTATION=+
MTTPSPTAAATSMSPTNSPASGKIDAKSKAVELFFSDMLSQMEEDFRKSGDSIMDRMKSIGSKMDGLEESISGLMHDAGLDEEDDDDDLNKSKGSSSGLSSSPLRRPPTTPPPHNKDSVQLYQPPRSAPDVATGVHRRRRLTERASCPTFDTRRRAGKTDHPSGVLRTGPEKWFAARAFKSSISSYETKEEDDASVVGTTEVRSPQDSFAVASRRG